MMVQYSPSAFRDDARTTSTRFAPQKAGRPPTSGSPPLIFVILETLTLQRGLQALPVGGKSPSCVVGVGGLGESIEGRTHRYLTPGGEIDESAIDRNGKIVAAPGRYVAVAQ